MGTPAYGQLVRSTGDNLDSMLASEVEVGPGGSALTLVSVRIGLNLGHPAGAGELLGVENPHI